MDWQEVSWISAEEQKTKGVGLGVREEMIRTKTYSEKFSFLKGEEV